MEVLRVRIDELLRMGFSKPTATALSQATNASQLIVVSQDDLFNVINIIEGYSGQLRDALQKLDEKTEVITLPPNIQELEIRISDLEARNI